MVAIKTFILGWLGLTSATQAAIITFDLRNLGETVHGGYAVRVEGVTLSFSRDSPGGVLVSTTLGLGIDTGYAGEVSGFINGRTGEGSGQGAESLFFLFSHDVTIQSVTLAWRGQGVVPVVDPKAVISSATVLGNGTTSLPGLPVGRTDLLPENWSGMKVSFR